MTFLFHAFENLCEEFDLPETEYNITDELNELRSNYYNLAGKIVDHLKTTITVPVANADENNAIPSTGIIPIVSTDPGTSSNFSQFSDASQNSADGGTFKNVVKLPPLELPTFNGQYEDWVTFEDSFKSMIHDNPNLSKIQKFHYLISALNNKAGEKIKVLKVNAANYDIAWEMLEKAYKAKRVLISRYLTLLLDLPVQQRESHEGLSKLATDTKQIIATLKSLNVNLSEEMIVRILESKLHKNTREKWEENLTRDEYPTLTSMYQFLDRYADVVSMRENNNKKRENAEQDSSSNKRHKISHRDGGHRAFATIGGKNCVACNTKQHFLFQCDAFKKMSVKERFELVKRVKVCFNCLRDHLGKPCTFSNCKMCNKKHNTLLHRDFSKNQHNVQTKSVPENREKSEKIEINKPEA